MYKIICLYVCKYINWCKIACIKSSPVFIPFLKVNLLLLLLMEEILHQLRQVKPVNTGTFTGPYQLVQDFFHQQYEHVVLSSDVQFDIEKYVAKSLRIGIYGCFRK